MADDLESLLRVAGVPDPERAEVHWAEYRSGGPGADAAFRTLLAWYGLAVYRRVWGFVRSTAADDVFQDVLAGLHRRRDRLATWADAHRWLRGTAIQTALAAHRREVRRKAREARRAVRPDDADGADGAERAAVQAELRAALAKLPAADRQVVALVYFEGLSASEAGRVLGKDRATVAAWQSRALDRLRRLLPAAGLTAGAGSAGVEGVLAAGRPVVSTLRLGELARSAWTRAVPGPTLGKAAAVLLAGLSLGGVGLAGWAARPAPVAAQVPPPKVEPVPTVERETLQAQNLRILQEDVLPHVMSIVNARVGTDAKVAGIEARGSDVKMWLKGHCAAPWADRGFLLSFTYCVWKRRLETMYAVLYPSAEHPAFTGRPTVFSPDGPESQSLRAECDTMFRSAFDLLPPDARAPDAWLSVRLDDGRGPLVVPDAPRCLTANSRYLYAVYLGEVVVRDAARPSDPWRWCCPVVRGMCRIAANDRDMFTTAAGHVWVRPGVAGGREGWRPFGALPASVPRGPGPFAATRDRVYVADPDGGLWSRPTAVGPAGWEFVGLLPDPRGTLMADEGRLYFIHSDGRVLAHPGTRGGDWDLFGQVPASTTAVVWSGRVVRWQVSYLPGSSDAVTAHPLAPSLPTQFRIGTFEIWYELIPRSTEGGAPNDGGPPPGGMG